MNIYDVSEHAGMSIATVSRVLNGSPNVSEKTREEALKAMGELGYTPNVFARGLGLSTIRTIGIMCSDSSDPYLADAICYLGHELRSHGYDAILCCTGYNLDTKQKYFNLLCSKRVGTIILAGSKFAKMRTKDNAYIIKAASDPPIMLASGFLEGENIYNTVCDDHTAMYGTASQLFSYGRRRILYVYTSYSYSGVSKLVGYKDALKAKDITPSDELARQCPKDIEATRELLLFLHREGLELDTVITSDDSLTVGVVRYVHIVGISIPHGLSIIDCNNFLLTRCTGPEITSTDSKVEVLYATTINTLMGVFSDVNMPSKTTIASDLIRRKTTNFQFLRRNITYETVYGQGFLTVS